MGLSYTSLKGSLKYIPGGFCGITAFFVMSLLSFTSYLHFPGYNIIDNMISDLGVGPGGLFFNIAMIISGVLFIPFFLNLGSHLKTHGSFDKFRKITVILGIISSVAYVFIGVFPDYFYIRMIHLIFAEIAFIVGVTVFIMITFLVLKNENIQNYMIIFNIPIVVALFTFFIFVTPLSEWMILFSLGISLVGNSIYLIGKNVNSYKEILLQE